MKMTIEITVISCCGEGRVHVTFWLVHINLDSWERLSNLLHLLKISVAQIDWNKNCNGGIQFFVRKRVKCDR